MQLFNVESGLDKRDGSILIPSLSLLLVLFPPTFSTSPRSSTLLLELVHHSIYLPSN